jgi:hypothetical protein
MQAMEYYKLTSWAKAKTAWQYLQSQTSPKYYGQSMSITKHTGPTVAVLASTVTP